MEADFQIRVERALGSLAQIRKGGPVEVGIVAGTGLGALADTLSGATTVPYGEIAGYPTSTAPGHAGRLVVGTLSGKRVAICQGRFHLYEGWSGDDVVMPIYLLHGLGARAVVLTNASGSLTDDIARGSLVAVSDHINMTGAHPLAGPNPDAFGPRFPDMSAPYSRRLRALAVEAGADGQGIYAGVHGPELETNAERRMLRMMGAHLVGMSTVHEVVAANHAGLEVLAIAAVTNLATGAPDQCPDELSAILAQADAIAPRLRDLVKTVVGRL